jgi:hypothetical protein
MTTAERGYGYAHQVVAGASDAARMAGETGGVPRRFSRRPGPIITCPKVG